MNVRAFACHLVAGLIVSFHALLAAGSLKPGDVIIGCDGNGSVVKVDSATGAQTLLANGFEGVHDVEIGPDGYIYVLEHARKVTRLDAVTGGKKLITKLGLLGRDQDDTFTAGITVAASGDIYVSVYASPYTGIVRVNPVTGQQTLAASGGFINGPIGIQQALNGKFIVGDVYNNSLLEVDPTTQSQRRLASGLPSGSPWYLAIASDTEIYLGKDTPASGNAIQVVNPVTGSHSVFVSGGRNR